MLNTGKIFKPYFLKMAKMQIALCCTKPSKYQPLLVSYLSSSNTALTGRTLTCIVDKVLEVATATFIILENIMYLSKVLLGGCCNLFNSCDDDPKLCIVWHVWVVIVLMLCTL